MPTFLFYLLSLFSLFCATGLVAQPVALTSADLRADLATVHTALERFHPSPYRYRDSVTVAALRARLLADAPERMTSTEAYRRIDRFVNYFNDAHTRVYATDLIEEYRTADGHYLPLEVTATTTTLLIRRHLGPRADSALAGREIRAINGVPATELLLGLQAHANRETSELDLALISTDFPHYLWLAFGWSGPFSLELATATGAMSTRTLPGLPYAALRADRAGVSPPKEPAPVSYRILADGSAYLRVRDFHRYRRKDFRAAFAEAFDHFRRQGATDRLILDLRDHDGGDARVGTDLARYLATEPFRPFAYSLWKATPELKETFKQVYLPGALHWALPILKGFNPHTRAIYSAEDGTNARVSYPTIQPLPARKRYPGDVTLLINEHTFSAGTCFAALFQDYELGTIAGRPSGNLATFHADALLRFRLPRTGLLLRVSTSYLVRPSGDEAERPVQPDVRVPVGVDMLAYVLDRASAD